MENTNQGFRKFCTSCGASYEDGSTFCPKCGIKIQAPAVPITPVAPAAQLAPTAATAPPPMPSSTPISQPPTVKGSKKTIAIVAIVAVVAVVALLIIAALASSGGGSGGGNNQGNTYVPKPNIQYVSATFSQDVLSGDVTVNVKVTNTGDAIGTKTIHVSIAESSGTYSNTKSCTLAPGETSTYSIVVNTPFGTSVTSNMIDVWLT